MVDHEPGGWSMEQLCHDRAEAGRQKDRMLAGSRIGVAILCHGTWLQVGRLPGRVWFEVDAPAGEPSKWLTLYQTRVFAWWHSEASDL